MNLTKEVKYLYTKIYKTLMEETKKTQVNGKILHVHRLEKFNIVEMCILLKVIYGFNPILI
jgi:hypothetical protein